jgi:hypothetical protein
MPPFARLIRASRYRRLAIMETDSLKSAMLRRLADEAECGLLRLVGRTDHLRALPAAIPVFRPSPYSGWTRGHRD